MARVIEVRNKIKSDDIFYIIRDVDVLTGEDANDYVDVSCTGEDLTNYILSFQTTFLDVLTIEVADLSNRITTYLSDFVDIKLLHQSHYESQTSQLAVTESNINKNRDDNNENSRVFSYLKKEQYRMTRLYHVIPPSFRENEIPEGGVQLLCDEGDDQTFANVKYIRAHRVDITGEERNFWAVFPGDILEVVGQKLIVPDNPDHKVNTSVEYRAIYMVLSGWNIVDSKDDEIMNIPVTLKNSRYDDIQYSFDGTTVPGDLIGNVEDYVYGQFSIFPTLDVNRYQELLHVYNDFVNVSPIGTIMPWFETSNYNSAEFISKYGLWEINTDLRGFYLVGQGKVAGTSYEFRYLNTSYRTQTTRKPKSHTNRTDTQSDHSHTVTINSAGEHKHMIGNGKYTGGTKNHVHSSKDFTDFAPGRSHILRDDSYSILNPDFDDTKTISADNKKYLQTHKHTYTLGSGSSHNHSGGFSSGWDTYNRMKSRSCYWLEKKEHPQYIQDIRERLTQLYGSQFDKT